MRFVMRNCALSEEDKSVRRDELGAMAGGDKEDDDNRFRDKILDTRSVK